uniref:Uncharacterized protein n=1 Tax=Romanomermis culicivorax TaxID=13658 RepID=A0A915LBA3_ROMCU
MPYTVAFRFQDILEHIWSAKPISTDPLSSSTGAGIKRSSIKRGSLINRSKDARKLEQSSALMSNVDVENE